MSENLEQLLRSMLGVAYHLAPRIPTRDDPPDDAAEKAADEYALRGALKFEFEEYSPEVAVAMIPRLRFALHVGSVVERRYEEMALAGVHRADEHAVLETLLVTLWRESGRALWLEGDFD